MHRNWGSWGGWGPWSGWHGFGRWGRFFAPGELRLALLSLLVDGPKHGYELMKALEARTGGGYRASAGAVYPTLQQMEDEGLVTSEQKDGKRVYQVTEAGRSEYARNEAAIKEMWERAAGSEDWSESFGPHIAGMAGPAAHLMKAALRAAARCQKDADKTSQIYTILDKARRDLDALV